MLFFFNSTEFNRKIFFAAFLGIALSAIAIANEIACDVDVLFSDGDLCCLVLDSTIDAPNYSFSHAKNDSVSVLDFSRNRQIQFLPIHVHKSFPHLVSYAAEYCNVQNLSKQNFEQLFHLRNLNLNRNKIESFNTVVFEDLVSLSTLSLGK